MGVRYTKREVVRKRGIAEGKKGNESEAESGAKSRGVYGVGG